MDAAVVKVPLYSKLLYMYSHVINIINAGLKKVPFSHPGKVDFPARQVTFHQYLLVQLWARTQANHLLAKS